VNDTVGAPVAALYQPLGAGLAGLTLPEIVGAVPSRLTLSEADDVPPALVAVHVNVMPAGLVSVVSATVSQPLIEIIGVSGSTTVKLMVGTVRYHPLDPSGVGGSMCDVMSGGEKSTPTPLKLIAKVWPFQVPEVEPVTGPSALGVNW
jgi:hypothetical protein